MKTYTQHTPIQPICDTQESPFCFHSIPDQKYEFLWPFNLEIFMNVPFAEVTYNLNENTHFQQFRSRVNEIIILKAVSNKESTQKVEILKKNSTVAKFKQVPITQKDSRNVISNLLRIFFKIILQLDHYGGLIQRIIEKLSLSITKSQFYIWLSSFNINFKNYIRLSQIRRIFSQANSDAYQSIFHILLTNYLHRYAPSHCLTSKRIDLSSIKMHLQGLRDLRLELIRENK